MKRIIRLLFFLFFAGFLTSLCINLSIIWSGNKRISTTLEKVVDSDIAIVLGTSERIKGGMRNQYFDYRIKAAEELYKNGKVKKILVSGDNGHRSYNEPLAMQKALLKSGIPVEDIILDYAGFRTFDSMVRAKKIFGVDKAIIVSQRFHLLRALYIAEKNGVKAKGYEAIDPGKNSILMAREYLARTKAFLDCRILNTQPKFLGNRIEIDYNS